MLKTNSYNNNYNDDNNNTNNNNWQGEIYRMESRIEETEVDPDRRTKKKQTTKSSREGAAK